MTIPPFKNCKGWDRLTFTSFRAQKRSFFPRFSVLTCAGHVVVPVYERTLWVVAPGPNVELEE